MLYICIMNTLNIYFFLLSKLFAKPCDTICVVYLAYDTYSVAIHAARTSSTRGEQRAIGGMKLTLRRPEVGKKIKKEDRRSIRRGKYIFQERDPVLHVTLPHPRWEIKTYRILGSLLRAPPISLGPVSSSCSLPRAVSTFHFSRRNFVK